MVTMKNLSQGYSIIELTIVVGLLSILSITISAVVLSTIVNSTRLKNQIRIRQTGDFAIGQIATMIRNAKNIESCDESLDTISIRNPDNRISTLSLGGTNQIASSSATTVYMTPTDILSSNFEIICLPSTSEPQLVKISFTLEKSAVIQGKTIEMPKENFTLSAEIRN